MECVISPEIQRGMHEPLTRSHWMPSCFTSPPFTHGVDTHAISATSDSMRDTLTGGAGSGMYIPSSRYWRVWRVAGRPHPVPLREASGYLPTSAAARMSWY